MPVKKTRLLVFLVCTFAVMFSSKTSAQNKKQPYVRIAKIVIDSLQIENYKTALALHAKAAVSKEKGVLTLYAVYDKDRPSHITVFEIYASVEAYKSHIKTPHFLKYKETVKEMVQSLELTDVVPIALEEKH